MKVRGPPTPAPAPAPASAPVPAPDSAPAPALAPSDGAGRRHLSSSLTPAPAPAPASTPFPATMPSDGAGRRHFSSSLTRLRARSHEVSRSGRSGRRTQGCAIASATEGRRTGSLSSRRERRCWSCTWGGRGGGGGFERKKGDVVNNKDALGRGIREPARKVEMAGAGGCRGICRIQDEGRRVEDGGLVGAFPGHGL